MFGVSAAADEFSMNSANSEQRGVRS